MEHMTVKAAATATDLGQFTAIAAAYTVDRQNEQIRGARSRRASPAGSGAASGFPCTGITAARHTT
jgi:hypothetical protein